MKATADPPAEERKNSSGWLLWLAIWTCWLGVALLGVTGLSLLVASVYEWIVPPTDMHLLGLLSAAMLFYLAPVGAALIAIGGTAWIGVAFATRKNYKDRSGGQGGP